ncbi:TraB/GumN family protein [Arenibacterium sp. LLYu02]|uniref:TraB/GumN family protein n=1 Tax=Arenibacterium sp. LLYu02 TaxID=3404132 RepID=UPI003B2104C3
MSAALLRRRPKSGRSGLSLALRAAQAGVVGVGLLLSPMAEATCLGTDLRAGITPEAAAQLDAAVAATPFATGLSWQATRGARQIRIIGTMHLNDPRHGALVEHMRPALAAADVLLVEATEADKSAMKAEFAASPELIFITEGPTLIERMPEAEWQAVADLAQDAGIAPFMAAKMRPWFLSLSLSIPACARAMPEVDKGLDVRLMEVAEAQGLDTRALEDPMGLIKAFNADPLDKQVADLTSYLSLFGVGTDSLFTMMESYFDGDVARYMMLEEQRFLAADSPVPVAERAEEYGKVMELMLTQRNRAWVPVIEATEGDHLVIAVGALHLSGPKGLLALLQDQGYVITEVPL